VLRPTRLLALGALVSIGLLYWSPLRSYEHTAAELRAREAQVAALTEESHALRAQITAVGSGEGLVREARRLGFVKPGEQLFIVRGIATWRAKH
jgi:cell division protein FtsB